MQESVCPTDKDGVSLWQTEALCVGADLSIFFDGDKSGTYRDYCNNCPVRGKCEEFAILYNLSGIWGGKTEKERRKLSKVYVTLIRDDAKESGTYNPELKV
ncbi:WhiB family transcriptional regulator [Streptomyces hebeiensis]